jgi:protein O-GlcNAc transferase
MTIPQALQIAVQHHQAGRLSDAEALYRQILAVQPNHADALHLLGVIAHQAGHDEAAVGWIRQAIVLNPNHGAAYCNLGEAYRALGRLEEAIATCRRALELEPNYPEAHLNLGAALSDAGQLDEAMAAYRRAIALRAGYPEAHNNLGAALAGQGRRDEAMAAYRRALDFKPDLPEAHKNLGNALRDNGQFDEAIAAYRRALQLKPNYPEALNSLGIALRERGRLDEAAAAYRRALGLQPDYPEAHNNLGAVLAGQGQLDEAIAACRRALELKPDYAEAHNNLGAALVARGRVDEAIAACQHALDLKPDYAEAHNNLGNALKDQGELDEAIAAYRHALDLKPDYPEAHNNLGNALKDQGELDEAIAAYRRALQIMPESAYAHNNLVYSLHLHPGHNARTISEEHQRWNRRFSDPMKPFLQPHANDPAVTRRLRVGYVSPDFLDHAVGRYVLPLLERHDGEQFEILCYSGVARPDWMTERLRALAGPARWRNTVGVPDARLAEMIREDGVDILVDLTMHAAGNRLPVFARQPAPVQVTWLAYPGGTGLHSIGYRLTDAHMDPGDAPAWSVEEPVRLPDCWCCYEPVGDAPEINALPALSAKGVTFGSLNNFAKVHEGVLALWVRVLEAVKGSRLLMLCPKGRARERVRAFFGARGIATERVELAGFLPRWEYLSLYQRIDLGLDPFPFNGMTTTCDALWMGVPVLTLPGKMPASRAGLSLLSTVGLAELAATSEEDYVRMAVELAGNLRRLANLRATLRARMRASPLMDAPRFARNVETAYRKMWQVWCAGQAPIRKET